jgi:hypothetical protein
MDPEIKRERQREYSRRWREKHPEKAREVRERFAKENPAKVKASAASYAKRKRAEDPLFYRRHNLKRNYDMSLEAYGAMLNAQGGVCAICKSASPGCHPNFHVDHDHTTGAVRALLCFECNRGLGAFKDKPELLLKAVAYLQKYGTEVVGGN